MLIKELRQKIDMTQQSFATEIQASLRTVAKWEADTLTIEDKSVHPLFRKEFQRLVKKFGVI